MYEGKCYQTCPIHTAVAIDGITCELKDCERREKRQIDGTCGYCPDY